MTAIALERSGTSTPPDPTPWQRPRVVLGDPTPLACTVTKAIAEAFTGTASLAPINRWLAPSVREKLARQQSLARRAPGAPAPARIHRARIDRVNADVAEAAVVVDIGNRTRAVALRFEMAHGRWLVTSADVL
ncbi:Rv3235 family protein [Demequina sediminicola]|uniref:Rv3235 family protein n=1 Tax=Demequina sediminicola TaxID=1095026 RepID=UPI0007834FDF|nr:Rv3235 family protein [Demequina sediminicola]